MRTRHPDVVAAEAVIGTGAEDTVVVVVVVEDTVVVVVSVEAVVGAEDGVAAQLRQPWYSTLRK